MAFQTFARFSIRRRTPVSMFTVRPDMPAASRAVWYPVTSSALNRSSGLSPKCLHKRLKPFFLELHRPFGDVRLAFLQVNLYGLAERLARKLAARLRSALALLDRGNAILLEFLRLPLIGCVQRLTVTNALDRYVEVLPVTGASSFESRHRHFGARVQLRKTTPDIGQCCLAHMIRRYSGQAPPSRDTKGCPHPASRRGTFGTSVESRGP